MTGPLLRWRALIPLALVLILLGIGWRLFLDRLVEKGIEETGARVVGARVDLASADVRLRAGAVTLRGLQVTNPDAPMTNLFEADEIVADVLVVPLLETKVVVETLAVRGVRFGTARETSGALERPPPGSGELWRQVHGWSDRVKIPAFSLQGLRGVINVDAIRPDSLRSLALARRTATLADSMQDSWRSSLAALNPQLIVDSARSLTQRLRNAQPLRLGLAGVSNLVQSTRSTVGAVEQTRGRLAGLDSTVRRGMNTLETQTTRLAEARRDDYAYARSLLQLSSLDAPDISPALFGSAALSWVQPVLYWTRLLGEYLPPGLDPRRRPGPDRVRQPGVTVQYPGRAAQPRFLLEHADVDFVLGGAGAAAGSYAARVAGLTTAPTLYGKPVTIGVERLGAAAGPRDVRLHAELNHVRSPIRDSVAALLRGIKLPTLELPVVGARLHLGEGTTDLLLRRVGDSLALRWLWTGDNVTWERRTDGQAVRRSDVEDLVWRAVSSLQQVQIEVRLAGSVTAPSIGVSSNVGDAIAQGLRRELGREIDAAEQRVRAEVDRLVTTQVAEARARVAAVETGVRTQVDQRLAEVREVEDQLRGELERLLGRLPPGFRP
jgi:uncharacterized protein (TIGR03545 family)